MLVFVGSYASIQSAREATVMLAQKKFGELLIDIVVILKLVFTEASCFTDWVSVCVHACSVNKHSEH